MHLTPDLIPLSAYVETKKSVLPLRKGETVPPLLNYSSVTERTRFTELSLVSRLIERSIPI